MSYESQLQPLWRRILQNLESDPEKLRGPFMERFKEYFRDEQDSVTLPTQPEVYQFRAEARLWNKYLGESSPFPGLDPSPRPSRADSNRRHSTPLAHDQPHDPEQSWYWDPQNQEQALVRGPQQSQQPEQTRPANKDPRDTRRQLESILSEAPYRRGYHVQLGWDPAKGEPWMAVRCYADRAYPSLTGKNLRNFKALHAKLNSIKVQFQRIETPDRRFPYVLVWLEFSTAKFRLDPKAQEEFLYVWKFFLGWAKTSEKEWSVDVHEAYDAFRKSYLPEEIIKGIRLPEGFSFDPNIGVDAPRARYDGNRQGNAYDSRPDAADRFLPGQDVNLQETDQNFRPDYREPRGDNNRQSIARRRSASPLREPDNELFQKNTTPNIKGASNFNRQGPQHKKQFQRQQHAGQGTHFTDFVPRGPRTDREPDTFQKGGNSRDSERRRRDGDA